MRTLLDEANSWFLESLAYSEGEVRVTVVEGIRSDVAEDIVVGGHVIQGAHTLQPSAESRRVAVRFLRPVAWQVVDESYTSFEESEVRDDTCFLQILTQSGYLKYVETHHGWYKDIVGPATHYRLWTENEVLDVIAHGEPIVEPLRGS